MKRTLARVLVGAMLALAVAAVVPHPAVAQSFQHPCPSMSDSITRLYYAYFGRAPDNAGFESWVNAYQTGQLSLEEISEAFARSEEFAVHNTTSNQSYATWIYRNLLDREPTADELEHWVQALDGGYPRGSVMVTFTESSDWVQRTNTAVPLAGFRRWYPKGTHWYCNVGAQTIGVNPLVGDTWADYYFYNRGDSDQATAMYTLDSDGRRNTTMRNAPLSTGFTDYNWDGVFNGNGDYGRYLEVQAGRMTDWIVVFYPRSIGEDRLGWQIS